MSSTGSASSSGTPTSTTEHLEVESTFEIGAESAPPGPDAFSPLVPDEAVEHTLSAVYYDTADLSLTRHKVTLRRRTGGDDAGWHLKLPAAAGRTELREPLGDAEVVPASLVDAVVGLVRGRELTPVARVDNSRTEVVLRDDRGEAVVEFCDDHVTTESFVTTSGGGSWREWELELVDGHRSDGAEVLARAAAACVAAGASPSKSASKLARALGQLPADGPAATATSPVAVAVAADLEQMLDHDPGARRGTMVGVHQMRVAVRGLRSTVTSHAPELDEPARSAGLDLPTVSADLKELAAVLGRVRDVQVAGERLAELYGQFSEDLVPASVRTRIGAELAVEEERARTRVAAALRSDRYLELLETLHRLVEVAGSVGTGRDGRASKKNGSAGPSRLETQEVVLRGVDRQFAKFTKVRTRTERDLDSLDLSLAQREELTHVVRKRAKALRRNVNDLPSKGGLAVAPLRTACNRLHTVLGEIQDSVTTREKLRRIARRAEAAGEPTFGFGVLFEHERGFSERALAGFENDAATVTAAYRELAHSRKAQAKGRSRKKGKKK